VGRSIRGVAVLVGALGIAAVAATTALGTAGQISKASVASDWTRGSFAGEMEWTGCTHLPPKEESKEPGSPDPFTCTWTAYATVGPGASPEACLGSDHHLGSLGAEVQLVWQSAPRTGVGSEAFEVNDLPLNGVPGKVFCLATAEQGTDGSTIPCVPPGEPIPPGWHCPYRRVTYFSTLDSRVLEVAPLPLGGRNEGEGAPKPCVCPALRHLHRHHLRRRHRRIFVSQRQEVPKS
jgi:hypothetical protein